MASAYYNGSYYLWVAIELTFGIIYSFILNWKINQVYPWLCSEVRQGKQLFKKYPEVMIKTKQLFVHKISGFVQGQTSSFLIYAFESLQMVACYNNYTIIIDKLAAFVNNFIGSVGAGIGNLIAEGNTKKIREIFFVLLVFRFWIAGILVFLLYSLVSDFIVLWVGTQYVLPEFVVILLLINFFIIIV